MHVRETPGEAELDKDAFGDIAVAELNGAPAPTITAAGRRGRRRCARDGSAAHRDRAGLGHVPGALLGRLSAPLLLVRPGMRPLTDAPAPARAARGQPLRLGGDALRRRAVLHARPRDRDGARRHRGHARRDGQHAGAARASTRSTTSGRSGKRSSSMRFSQCTRGRPAPRERCASATGRDDRARGRGRTTRTSSSSRGAAAWTRVAARPCAALLENGAVPAPRRAGHASADELINRAEEAVG